MTFIISMLEMNEESSLAMKQDFTRYFPDALVMGNRDGNMRIMMGDVISSIELKNAAMLLLVKFGS